MIENNFVSELKLNYEIFHGSANQTVDKTMTKAAMTNF